MKKKFILLIVLCCVLSIFTVGCEQKSEKIVWDNYVLGNKLPEIKNKRGTEFYNSDSLLILYIEETTSKEYYQYIDDCKGKGYIIDIEKDDFGFRAFNEEGYELNLNYFDSMKELEIRLEVPAEYDEIKWPTIDIANMIPETSSKTGEILEKENNIYFVEIANTSKSDLEEYIASCKEKGFDKNIDTEFYTYYAENEEGYRLTINYKGFNIITILVEEPQYEVTLTIKSIENKIMNKYDVDISIDDEYFDTIEHGKKMTFKAYLTKDYHTITLYKDTDYDVEGFYEFTTDGEDELNLEITCSTTEIKVKEK